MKRTGHQADGTHGEKIVEAALSPLFLVTKPAEDFGIDIHATLAPREGEVTGVSFFGQVKTRQTVKESRPTYREKTETLRWIWRTQQRLPVFYLLVDLSEKQVFWLFVHEYLAAHPEALKDDAPKTSALRFSRHKTLTTPLSNFVQAAEAAFYEMPRLFPQNVLENLRATETLLEKQYPGHQFQISADRGEQRIQITRSDGLPTFIASKSLPVQDERFQNLVGFGIPTSFSADEVNLGTPSIWSDLMGPGGTLRKVELGPTRAVDIHGEIVCRRGDTDVHRTSPFAVRLSSGEQGGFIDGGLFNSPLWIKMAFAFSGDAPVPSGSVLDLERWKGQIISGLAHFDALRALVRHWSEGATMRLVLHDLRGKLAELTLQNSDGSAPQIHEKVFASVDRVRRAFAFWPVAAPSFDAFLETSLPIADSVSALLLEGKCTVRESNLVMGLNTSRERLLQISEACEKDAPTMSLGLNTEHSPLPQVHRRLRQHRTRGACVRAPPRLPPAQPPRPAMRPQSANGYVARGQVQRGFVHGQSS